MGPVFFLLTHVIVVHCSHVCRKGIHLFDVDNKRIRHALQLSVGSSSRRRPGSPGLPPPRGAVSLPVCKVAAYAFPVALSAAKLPIVLPLTALPSTSLLSPGASAGLGLPLAPLGAGKA